MYVIKSKCVRNGKYILRFKSIKFSFEIGLA